MLVSILECIRHKLLGARDNTERIGCAIRKASFKTEKKARVATSTELPVTNKLTLPL